KAFILFNLKRKQYVIFYLMFPSLSYSTFGSCFLFFFGREKKNSVPNNNTVTPSHAPLSANIKIAYSIYNEVRQNTTGSTGYKGTRIRRGAYGSLYRRTKSAIPIHEIKNQNIRAVKFTIDSNPLRPKEPTMIKKTAIKDCVSKAFIGLEVSDFQVRIKEKTGKSRP